MSGEKSLVSIVCPAYQEEEVLPLFHRELTAALVPLERDYRFEILYVDDGSPDGTLDAIKQLARQDPRVAYLALSRNFGQQAALTAGLEHARGEAIISMDTDLQHPPRVLAQLLDTWQQGYDIVLTIRADDQRLGLFKRFSSAAFYWVMSRLSDTDIRLAASDFRLMSRRAVQALVQLREQHRFLRGLVQWLGFRSAEIEFMPDVRKAGHTKYTLRRMLRLAGDGLFSFSLAPLRLAGYLGLAAVGLGLAHSAWYGVQCLRGIERVPLDVEYLILSTHLLGGAVLTALSFLGEYVGRIYEQVKGRPVYILKDQSPRAVPEPQREAA